MNGVSCTQAGGILRVTLNRPEKLNAVNTPMLDELTARVEDAASDQIRAVVLTGAGRAFCAGGDLSGRNTHGAAVAANRLVRTIVSLPKPVIAGVHGPAVGFGCSLAMACDLVIAARSAYFQLAFTKVGLMPDGGASALLSATVGRPRALRLALMAEKLTAAEAFEWGMISHIAHDDEYDSLLSTISEHISAGATQSYQWIKRALTQASLSDLATLQELEAQGQTALVATADFRNAVEAFSRGEKPHFTGR
jgi:enoyl-CoA hydratase